MHPANKPKAKLSRNLLQMKFMKRTKERVEIDAENEERQAMFRHEITSEMRKQGNRFVFEPSFVPMENLVFGRMAFHNMNPEIEKMMDNERLRAEERAALAAEKDVHDEEMAEHFGSLHNTIGRKFATKRSHQEATAAPQINPDAIGQNADELLAEGVHIMNKAKGQNWHRHSKRDEAAGGTTRRRSNK